MNAPVTDLSFRLSVPPDIASPEWQRLFDHIALGAAERERERLLPFEAVDLLKRARFGALRLRKEEGGAGATLRELYAIAIRLAAADANVAHIFRNHFTVAEQYARTPYDAQSRLWQQQVSEGAIFGLASTETGPNPAGGTQPDTLLTPEGDGFRLNGVKYYSTGTLYADLVLVRAADPDKRFVSIIIPVKRDGIEILDDWDGAGQRLTASGTTRYHNVRVEAAEAVFDLPGRGYGLSYSNTQAQLFLTAVVAGIARAILEDAIALLKRRQRSFYYAHFPVPADDLLLQQTIGQLSANAFAAEAAVLAAADALDRTGAARDAGEPDGTLAADAALAAANAKIVVDDLALRSGSLLFEVGGASATERRFNLDRHWRNARTIASHNPASFKAQAIGALLVKGEPLPARGFF